MSFPGLELEEDPSSLVPGACARESLLQDLSRLRGIDLVIVGPGPLASMVANYAAFQGLRVVLVCSGDFLATGFLPTGSTEVAAQGVSANGPISVRIPRSSISISSIRSLAKRAASFETFKKKVPHLVASINHSKDLTAKASGSLMERILSPIFGWLGFKGWQNIFGQEISVDLERLSIEAVLGARQEGAVTLNYLAVCGTNRLNDGLLRIDLTDEVTASKYSLISGAIFDCRARLLKYPADSLPHWVFSDGIFRVKEYSALDLFSLAESSLREALERSNLRSKLAPWRARPFPGGSDFLKRIAEWRAQSRANAISDDLALSAQAQLGGRVTYFDRFSNPWRILKCGQLQGVFELSILTEQPGTVEDLIHRALPANKRISLTEDQILEISDLYAARLPFGALRTFSAPQNLDNSSDKITV